MSILNVITYPHIKLSQKAQKVSAFCMKDVLFVNDMIDTMHYYRGCGLAAVQVGELKQIIVMEIEKNENELDLYVMINPKIISKSDDFICIQEGCISVPSVNYEVPRFSEICLEYLCFDMQLLNLQKNHNTDNNCNMEYCSIESCNIKNCDTNNYTNLDKNTDKFNSKTDFSQQKDVETFLNQEVKLEKKTITVEGLTSICAQHEIDHLNGILFWDHIDNTDTFGQLKDEYFSSQEKMMQEKITIVK